MKLPKILGRGLPITMLMATAWTASVLFAAACTGESVPTATPKPTPVPTPTPTLSDVLASAGEKLAAMSTAKFKMVDELESGAKFFGTTFKSMEAEVKAPDSFRMVVEVVAPGFGFVEIEMLAVGEQAFLKLSKDAPWASLPLDQVPFNFAGLGKTLSDLLVTIEDGAITGRESVERAQAIRIEGSLGSEELSNLITSADPGLSVNLTLWIDEAELTLRKIRIAGQIYADDAPETVRVLTIEGIDVPVDIQLPEAASGP